MSPSWYYGATCTTGLVNWVAIALSSISDVIPSEWRAPSFGLLLAGFSLGFAFSPLFALVLGHFCVSVFSLVLVVVGIAMTIVFLPETLPTSSISMEGHDASIETGDPSMDNETFCHKVFRNMTRPIKELSILNRNKLFRLLSTLAFFSGMVSSADQTFMLYYVEEQLGFTDDNVALLFVLVGMLGILVQGVFIKPVNDCIGERFVICLSFLLGSVSHILYGIAKSKALIYVGVVISSFAGMSFPTISAIKSNNVVRASV